MEIRSISYHQQKIFYRICGSGYPLILLHGFGEDGGIWESQINELADEFKCIIPDLPGTGRSVEALVAETEWSMEKFALVVKEIAEKENVKVFTLLGHSMGGYITLAFAENYPEMLKGIGLIHSTAYADNDEKIAARKNGISFIENKGAALFLEQMIPNLYGDPFKAHQSEEINRHIETAKEIPAESLIAYYKAMINRPDRSNTIKSLLKPLLFIIGAGDKALNLYDSLAQCHLPDESHVFILSASGHMGMCEEALKTTSAMKAFLWRLNEN